MYFEKAKTPSHSGTERYTVTFALKEQDDLYDTKGVYVEFEFRPEFVVLVWERDRDNHGYGSWVRKAYGVRSSGSRVLGPRVLKNGGTSDRQQGYQPVFLTEELGGPLSGYASSLPHLGQMIAELEKNLPA